MHFNQFQQLLDLISLRFTAAILQIHQLRNTRPDKNVMAAADAIQSKPKCLRQPFGLFEAQTLRVPQRLLKQFAPAHPFLKSLGFGLNLRQQLIALSGIAGAATATGRLRFLAALENGLRAVHSGAR